jgi:hypothetical protein
MAATRVYFDLEIGDQSEASLQSAGWVAAQEFFEQARIQVSSNASMEHHHIPEP